MFSRHFVAVRTAFASYGSDQIGLVGQFHLKGFLAVSTFQLPQPRIHAAIILDQQEFLYTAKNITAAEFLRLCVPAMEAGLTDHLWSVEEVVGVMDFKMSYYPNSLTSNLYLVRLMKFGYRSRPPPRP
jgi:hypothetical protein